MISRHPLEQRLLSQWRATPLAHPGDRVLVSVSGGADSLALLRLLHVLREPLGLELEVVHFDHGLRPESESEAQWVASRAEELGLPFHLRRHETLGERIAGMQATAREWRRAESLAILHERGAQFIATGHQQDDHLETLVLKLLRGVHLARIRGLPGRTGLWIRPLIGFTHGELCAYLESSGEEWLEDPSNTAPRYKRNRVRNELMPLLDELAGGAIARRLNNLEAQSAQLEALLTEWPVPTQDDEGAPPYWIESNSLAALPPLVRGARLHEFIQQRLPGAVDSSVLEQAHRLLDGGRNTWELDLSQGRSLRRRGGRILLERRETGALLRSHECGSWRVVAPPSLELALREEKDGEEDGAEQGMAIHNLPPGASLEIRTRRPGDRIHLPGRRKPVKVADLLRDRGVPLWERDAVPVVLCGGQVVALYPHAVAVGHEQDTGAGGTLRVIVSNSP